VIASGERPSALLKQADQVIDLIVFRRLTLGRARAARMPNRNSSAATPAFPSWPIRPAQPVPTALPWESFAVRRATSSPTWSAAKPTLKMRANNFVIFFGSLRRQILAWATGCHRKRETGPNSNNRAACLVVGNLIFRLVKLLQKIGSALVLRLS